MLYYINKETKYWGVSTWDSFVASREKEMCVQDSCLNITN